MTKAVQSDWLQDIRDGETVSSKEMAYYVGELNRIDPAQGASKQKFTATEVALALFGTTDTKCVYGPPSQAIPSMKSSGSFPAFMSIRNLRHSAAPLARHTVGSIPALLSFML